MSPFSWLRVLADLGKFRITVAVTLTTTLGYVMARRGLAADIWMPLLGTFLLASGASALNQCQESALDARMARTRGRPIPAGHIDHATALFIAGLLILGGLFFLTSGGGHVLDLLLLSAGAVFWYNGVYTYLKRVTAFAVVPGAAIGAVPPVIGYCAAGGHVLDPAILLVGLFLFIWQIPHFWLLMILLEDQYAQAGLPTLGRTFSRAQLHRVTFMWILASAAAGLVCLPLMGELMLLPWNLLVILASCWLATTAVSVLWAARRQADASVFRRAFIRINAFALVLVIALCMSSLGMGWR